MQSLNFAVWRCCIALSCSVLCVDTLAAAPRIFLANDYGAIGDGNEITTKAIQAALYAAGNAGGGIVKFAPGTYVSGSIFVKSGTELHLDQGVTLRGVGTLDGYPMLPTRVAGIEITWPAALINIYGQHDASITGSSTIDGDGKVWWDRYWTLRRQYEPKGLRWAADYDSPRPRLIQICNSNHVKLSGLLLTRSGFWTIHICYSENVHVDGVTIRNNEGGRGPSTDGIDIDSSRHILVEHADISVNDDALCLKAGRDSDGLRVARPDEDIVVRDSIVRDGAAAITLGSETSGGFRNIEVSNIHALAKVPAGVLFKSAHTRGGWTDSIRIHDIQLDGVATPININLNWNPSYSYASISAGLTNFPSYYKVLATPVSRERGLPHFRKVHIWNLRATGARHAFDVSATPEAPLEDFALDHIDIEARSAGTVQDTRNWTLSNIDLHIEDGTQVTFKDSTGLKAMGNRGASEAAPQP